MPRKKEETARNYGSEIRRKSERRRRTLKSAGISEAKHSVDHRSPLQDHTNFNESTPKASQSGSVDLVEMDWGEVPELSPIKNGSWSPEPSLSDTPTSSQEPQTYYIAPTVRYDNVIRPRGGKRLKKEKKNKQLELETWMKKLNEEFSEIEKHELVIVKEKR